MKEYERPEYTHGTSINWYENEWFVKFHIDDLTSDFAQWWLNYYDTPDQIEDRDSDDYWVRCAFALAGFRVGRQKQ